MCPPRKQHSLLSLLVVSVPRADPGRLRRTEGVMQSLVRAACLRFRATGFAPCRAGALNVIWGRDIQTGFQRFQMSTENANSTAETTQSHSTKEFSLFPPVPGQESSLRWDGKKFEEIPVAHIKATYNNTHIQITSHENHPLAWTSCGTEGFKNIKKSTGIAAQTAAISAASKAIGKGVSHVRVVVKGLGPGRLSAIKGLTMGGLEVISITDNTPIPHNGCRPRKARRM